MSRTASFASVAKATGTQAVSWSTNQVVNSDTILTYFLQPYLLAHRLSEPSKRPAYVLWFAIAFIFFCWSIEHVLTRKHMSAFGALRDKISMRRFCFTLGKAKTPKPGQRAAARRLWTTATIAQMISMVLMLAGIAAACFWGNDYLNPNSCIFGGYCPHSSSAAPPQSTYISAIHVLKESVSQSNDSAISLAIKQHRKRAAINKRQSTLNPNGYAPMNDPLLSSSNVAIHRTLWTSSARIGMIAFALCPLAVTLALKIWPFAAFAVPFLMAYEFDKTIMYHRWIGIIIWILSTAHTAGYTIQLVRDKDPYGRPILYDMLYYWHFYAACFAYLALCLMVILSFGPIRARYYEFFYASHMGLGLVFLVGCLLHFPPLGLYLIVALGLWAGERLTRLIWWFYINGYFHGLDSSEKQSQKLTKLHNKLNMAHGPARGDRASPTPRRAGTPEKQSPITEKPRSSSAKAVRPTKRPPPLILYQVDSPQHYGQHFLSPEGKAGFYPPSPASTIFPAAFNSDAAFFDRSTPPPGFALAQLLPGKNMRLTIHVPNVVHWRTGQYTSLTIPSVYKLQGHPFTIANADERQIRNVNQVGSEIVLLIGVRNGFTKKLWDEVVKRRKIFGPAAAASSGGTLIRAQIGQPTGTAGRARLDDFESVLVICGGTGISFGMAVMQHVCMSMAARESDKSPKNKKAKCKTQRVRFVWILREFAHLSWVAPAVRRCLDLLPPSRIRIDFFVTRDTKPLAKLNGKLDLNAPSSPFVVPNRRHRRSNSVDSSLSDGEGDHPSFMTVKPEPAAALDYVLFDGEDEEQTEAELQWSRKVQHEGKLRRANTRRAFTGKRQRPQRFGGASNSDTPVSSPHRRNFSQSDLKMPIHQDVLPTSTSHEDDLIDSYYSLNDNSAGLSPSKVYQGTNFNSESKDSLATHNLSTTSLANSTKGLLEQSIASRFKDEKADFALDVSESEMDDLHIISELARTGHPDVPKIMDEEQERAQGRLIVACCGPIKLNISVRAMVASRIDPIRVAKGDMRGSISLMVEDFE